MFCLLYRHTDDRVFDDFPNISEISPKLVRRSQKRCQPFSENFRRFPIYEEYQKLPKTFEEDPKMFRSYKNNVL